MLNLWKTPFQVIGTLFVAGLFVAAQGAPFARPGTVNYAEGQVTLDGQSIGAKALGSTEVSPGHVLRTEQGKAEMLLTPGVFLRLGDNSAVKMISPSLTDTRVELVRGKALVEVAEIQKENHLAVADNGISTVLERTGIYAFQASPPSVAVYDGKVRVQEDDRTVDVGKGRELPLTADSQLKPQKFDRQDSGSLYAWSKLRSEYLAEANQSSVQTIVVGGPWWGWGWYGAGWFWNPWFDTFAWIPANGFFHSPFGYGFYSPSYWMYNPPVRYYARPGYLARTPVRGLGGMRASTMRAPMVGGTAMRAPAMRAPAMRSGGFGGRR